MPSQLVALGARQLGSALAHLHSLGACHGDVKPANILLMTTGGVGGGKLDIANLHLKLCDFGFACVCGDQTLRGYCGTPAYCPPELAPALGRADAVVCVFCLSAILPSLHTSVARRLVRMLRPGGVVCFRDYGLYDMSQLRYGRTLRDESRTANHARLIFTYNFEAPYCANSRALEKMHN